MRRKKRHYALTVDFPAALEAQIDPAHRAALRGVLAHDPRPSYQSDPERMYGVAFAGKNVKFTVADGVLTVRKNRGNIIIEQQANPAQNADAQCAPYGYSATYCLDGK